MSFYIQASFPRYTYICNKEDTSLAEAIETSFPLYTESVIMSWNHVPIMLSYKYDIAYMVLDLLNIFDDLIENEKGQVSISWLPDSFRSDWDLWWENGNMHIVARWESLVGDIHVLLNRQNQIDISIKKFMSEWKKVLQNVIDALYSCGYTEATIEEMKNLEVLVRKIPGQGVLYEDQEDTGRHGDGSRPLKK